MALTAWNPEPIAIRHVLTAASQCIVSTAMLTFIPDIMRYWTGRVYPQLMFRCCFVRPRNNQRNHQRSSNRCQVQANDPEHESSSEVATVGNTRINKVSHREAWEDWAESSRRGRYKPHTGLGPLNA